MKKRKGTIVGSVITILLGILAITMVVLAYMNFFQLVSYKEEVKGYARSYLLEMETVGYLTPSSATSFRQELTDLGIMNIDLTGSTMSQVGYGNSIYLKLKIDVPYKNLNTSAGDFLNYFFEDVLIPISVEMKSTAKH